LESSSRAILARTLPVILGKFTSGAIGTLRKTKGIRCFTKLAWQATKLAHRRLIVALGAVFADEGTWGVLVFASRAGLALCLTSSILEVTYRAFEALDAHFLSRISANSALGADTLARLLVVLAGFT